MKTAYKEAMIEYLEEKNVWCSDYLGVKYVCRSLKEAKKYVDSVIGKKQYGKEAYLPLFKGFVVVKIVSELDKYDWCYIQHEDGKTDHIYSRDLFVVNDKNTKDINKLIELQNNGSDIEKKRHVLYSGLKKIF